MKKRFASATKVLAGWLQGIIGIVFALVQLSGQLTRRFERSSILVLFLYFWVYTQGIELIITV